jgi:DNA primase
MFPICDRQGRVVAFSARILDAKSHPAKYVNSGETDIFTKSRVLYALDKAASKIVKHPRREAIICEGQIDVIRCHACGFETAVASQGTAFTKEHVSLLKKHADSVVLVFDGDSAGRKAALRTGALFLQEEIPVRVAALPKGDDPDSMLRDRGPEPFRALLDNAVSITAFQIDTLRQAEPQPDSIDAVNRVARGVIEMLGACPNAVQRSHLLEEAAHLLHLPASAFEEDLERHREALSRKASYASSFKDHAPAAPSRPPRAEPEPAADDDRPPLADEFAPDGDGAEPAPPEEPAPEPPSRAEYLLCEFLVEHERDEAVLDLVERFLPLDIIPHPFARAVVDALLQQRRSGEDRLAELGRTAEPVWQPLLGSLIANKQKMLSAREATPLEAARDLITRLWVQRLRREQGGLDAASTPENAARRFNLSILIKNLETQPWEKACRLMAAAPAEGALRPGGLQDGQQAAARAAAAAAAGPSAHAADSACAAVGPDEFPPSEYPLDETLD